jgi:Flp pilus assembly protein TadD
MTVDEAMQFAVRCHQAGQPVEAEQLCRRILAAQPDHPDALNLLGVLAAQAGCSDLAIELIRRAIAVRPDSAEYHSNLGNLLRAIDRTNQAIAAYRDALAINPKLAVVHTNLGGALARQGQLSDAAAEHREAIQLDPNLAEAHSNLGNALVDQGCVEQAITACRAAVALNPQNAQMQFNLANCLLLDGNFAEGWPAFEWRLKCNDLGERTFVQPRWDGGDLTEKTILIHAEQGFGDTIQFIRFIPLITGRAGKVIVECQPELIELLRELPGVAEWIPRGQPLPPFDVHCPLLSLPSHLGTTVLDIPPQMPPLRAPPNRCQLWQPRMARDSARLKVGLAWAGNPSHQNDRNRTIPVSELRPLGQIAGVQWFSLQKGSGHDRGAISIPGFDETDLPAPLHDFADTAAVIEQLDLVISVDTAVGHLAGAMGKPVWLLLPFAADWRWLRNRSDSPWYPTMCLFRQRQPGAWVEAIQRVIAAIAAIE